MFADDVVTASRIIRLHAIPRSVCFSSERGDMLLGIGEQLHRIEHKSCQSSLLQYCCIAIVYARVCVARYFHQSSTTGHPHLMHLAKKYSYHTISLKMCIARYH